MKKTLTLVLSLALAVAIGIGGTLAWLTSSTGPVTNTFTVGKLAITLDEAPVDANGKTTTGDRGAGNSYKLMPGHTYDKDPTVHVQPGSEACFVFVKVENGISEIESTTNPIANQITTQGWTAVEGHEGYYYKQQGAVAEDAAVVDLVVFKSFQIADNANCAAYTDKQIVITACAIQADGMTNVADAFSKCPSAFTGIGA
ncbi:Uncharacterised protein [uncultured Flavonifractor sp.]|nr:hypothetical protein CE91St42_16470 [Oscillospiraceae bacterium]CUP33859.1 Uncharacterised protein [Flavonifractor plautii]SCJ49988.1 Uncharacterised protein [uncultured Flavonifractor sp.]